eukprot:15476515-Alexandrium_andersonii.AAC.1
MAGQAGQAGQGRAGRARAGRQDDRRQTRHADTHTHFVLSHCPCGPSAEASLGGAPWSPGAESRAAPCRAWPG